MEIRPQALIARGERICTYRVNDDQARIWAWGLERAVEHHRAVRERDLEEQSDRHVRELREVVWGPAPAAPNPRLLFPCSRSRGHARGSPPASGPEFQQRHVRMASVAAEPTSEVTIGAWSRADSETTGPPFRWFGRAARPTPVRTIESSGYRPAGALRPAACAGGVRAQTTRQPPGVTRSAEAARRTRGARAPRDRRGCRAGAAGPGGRGDKAGEGTRLTLKTCSPPLLAPCRATLYCDIAQQSACSFVSTCCSNLLGPLDKADKSTQTHESHQPRQYWQLSLLNEIKLNSLSTNQGQHDIRIKEALHCILHDVSLMCFLVSCHGKC